MSYIYIYHTILPYMLGEDKDHYFPWLLHNSYCTRDFRVYEQELKFLSFLKHWTFLLLVLIPQMGMVYFCVLKSSLVFTVQNYKFRSEFINLLCFIIPLHFQKWESPFLKSIYIIFFIIIIFLLSDNPFFFFLSFYCSY